MPQFPAYRFLTLMLCTLGVGFGLTVNGKAEEKTAEKVRRAEAVFAVKLRPLFKDKCLGCHGDDPQELEGGLDLRSREAMLKNGNSGDTVLKPGEPEKSLLLRSVRYTDNDLKMPPKASNKLTEEEVEWVREWIAAGAPWPEEGKVVEWDYGAEGVPVVTSGGRSADWTNRRYQPEALWAYQPLAHPNVPQDVLDPAAIKNPIDAFIQSRQKSKKLTQLSPAADRETLIRRATISLTGLPPTPQEVTEFVNNQAPDAYSQLLDRLLASPHYGEQMARHWLDVVRYADTSGFSNDYERPNAWRYRDYVIRSWNADKPFDRFIMEQLAGDELEPKNPEMLIAVGFLRMGPWEHTGMTVAAVTRQQYLDDVTNHVGVTLLGQALRCAACHDHKFDPVPTRDYYRIQAVFASTQFAERKVPYFPQENITSFARTEELTQQRLRDTDRVLEELTKKNQDALAAYLKEQGVKRLEDLPEEKRVRRDSLGLTYQELTIRKVYQKRRSYFEREMQRYEPFAFSLYSGPPNQYTSVKAVNSMPANRQGAVPVVHILPGGSLESPADAVTPGVLSAVFASNDTVQATAWNHLPETTENRRLAFARWVASPQNTLTARVIVNRVWQWNFGRGLVSTPNNFGKMGGRPSHPELLDWLAGWFIENGWSVKKLQRLIMTSATFQQSDQHPQREMLQQIDSRNELLAYFPPRRLAAEEIRDSMLAITGEWNDEQGGPGVFPEINWEVAFQPRHIMGSVAPAYQPSPTPAERNRRTIYAFRFRTLSDPLLDVFNRPGSEISCERRDETTVAPQAFALLNSHFVHHRSLSFAAQLQRSSPELSGQIHLAAQLVYGRRFTPEEHADCLAHVQKMTAFHRQHVPQKTELPTKVTRHMVEEMTGLDVSWEEELEVLKKYQPDLMPWDVSAETRALADLCLVLFNSNEFLYLR